MKRKVVASLFLGFLLVMNALDCSSAGVPHGPTVSKNELDVIRNTVIQVEKKSFDGNGIAHMGKLGLGGKKLIQESNIGFENDEKGADIGGTSSKKSGDDSDGLRKSLQMIQGQINDQKKHTKLSKPKASESENYIIPRTGPLNMKSKFTLADYNIPAAVKGRLKSSSSRPGRQIFEKPTQKDQTESLLDASKEIADLMNKDYKGMARGKPPIHNNQPKTLRP